MKKRFNHPAIIVMLIVLVSCVPAGKKADPASPSPRVSEMALRATATFTQTQTATSTKLPTVTSAKTLTFTAEPSVTQPFVPLPSATFKSTRTRRKTTPSLEPTFTATRTPTGTAPATATICPIPTAEAFGVAPVTSPTDQLSQIVTVYLGLGEQVTILTESGTFTDTTSPFQVEITLLPNTVHHLEVRGKVKQVWVNGCMYGGYTMSTRFDHYGAPLTIVQSSSYP